MRQLLVGFFVGALIGSALGLAASTPQSVLTSKLLEWPFLLFVSISIVVLLFYRPIEELLGRGDIRIKWGDDKEIQLKDLSRNFDKEIDPIAADVDQLRREFEELRTRVPRVSFGGEGGENSAPGGPAGEPEAYLQEDAWKIMQNAILGSQYKWRRVSTLAGLAGVNDEQALGILRSREEVMLGRNKESFPIATLKSKLNREASVD